MKPSLKIPLGLTYAVVLTGIIVIISRAVRARPFSTTLFSLWAVASVILIGITVWSWLRSRKK